MNWQGVCIHHSATKDSGTSSWEAIRKYHLNVNGWSEIGYHFGVEIVNYSPVIRIGRSVDRSGAHAVGLNDTHLGICIVGNFDASQPRADVLNQLSVLISDLAMIHGFEIDESVVKYHRDVANKTCPGMLFPNKSVLVKMINSFRGN